MSDRNSLEVAQFLERVARNWFIRHSLMIAAFGGLFNGLLTVGIFLIGLLGSSVIGWIIGLLSFFLFVGSIFLAGVHYIINQMHIALLGRDFDYLCDPQEYRDRS